MKTKRLLSVILSLAMAVSLLPMVSFAAGHSHGGVTFDAWSSSSSLPASGNYYLTKNVTLNGEWSVSGTVNLCLNGYVIKQSADNTRVIAVNNGGMLNLYDCNTTQKHYFTVCSPEEKDLYWELNNPDTKPSACTALENLTARPEIGAIIEVGGGCITGGKFTNVWRTTPGGCGVYVANGGTFNMNGGNIIGNSMLYGNNEIAKFGGGVMTEGVFNFNDGNIVGNSATVSIYCDGYGGGVGIYGDGIFNMNGGKIQFNRASLEGGGICANGEFHIYGGEISYNFAGTNGGGIHTYTCKQSTITGGVINNNISERDGGGVHIGNSGIGHNPAITGGKIINNISKGNGGGIYIDNTLTLDFTVQVSGNKKADGDGLIEQNFYAGSGSNLKIPNPWDTLQKVLDGTLDLSLPGFCEKTTNAQGVDTIKLMTDFVASSGDTRLTVPAGRTVILDLNGHTIDRHLTTPTPGGNVILINKDAVLTVKDSSGTDKSNGTGKITGGYNSNVNYTTPGCSGGVHNFGTFYFEGGTVCGNKTFNRTGGGVYNCGGTFVMSGYSTVCNNTAANYGGGVECYESSKMIMKDNSTVTGNTATYGGGIDCDKSSTLTMENSACVSGNTATKYGGGIYNNGGAVVTLKGNSKIINNTSGTDGGGIYCTGKSALYIGRAAIIENNKLSTSQTNNIQKTSDATVEFLKSEKMTMNIGGGAIDTTDYIYFGNQTKWRVLSTNGNTTENEVAGAKFKDNNGNNVDNSNALFILSENDFGKDYFDQYAPIEWPGSTAQIWCNGDFYTEARISDAEKSAILLTTKTDAEYINRVDQYNDYRACEINDKVFYLSAKEAETYLPADEDRIFKLSPLTSGEWWLRSITKIASSAGYVRTDGSINRRLAYTDQI